VKSKKIFFKKITFAMLAFALCTASLMTILAPPVHAQSSIDALVKQRVAPDLLEAITASRIDKKSNWIKEDRGVRFVKALIIANSNDVELTAAFRCTGSRRLDLLSIYIGDWTLGDAARVENCADRTSA
jgi:hypothetical protein